MLLFPEYSLEILYPKISVHVQGTGIKGTRYEYRYRYEVQVQQVRGAWVPVQFYKMLHWINWIVLLSLEPLAGELKYASVRYKYMFRYR